MAARAALPALLLCALLLLLLLLPPQIQGGPRGRRRAHDNKPCQKYPSINLCSQHCSFFQKCPDTDTCCSTYCGNVCMSLL
ncbi:WAP four-disulfide core domain protein 10A [Tamandua tetradactyla]|uniref:WAP four-disulfide core domain protein 10A n=1 Tax=Tamandua tetradactyla TaxID=48850 RepID=UPI0040543688